MTQRNMVWNRVRPRWWKGVRPLTLDVLAAGVTMPLAGQNIEPIVAH